MENNINTDKSINPKQQSLLKKFWLFFLDIAQTFIITGIVFFFVTYFFFRPFQVSGSSMYSTYLDKEYIITNIITLRFNEPKKGDVIVFKSPSDQNRDFIKRIIAVPGDTIFLKDGSVYLNGYILDESNYLNQGVSTYGNYFLADEVKKTIPPDNFFVMGDNRSDSSDSRQWGFVNRNEIKGVSIFVYWPLNEVKLIKNPFN
jgi:signal peptidase I